VGDGLEYLVDARPGASAPSDFDAAPAVHVCCVRRDARVFAESALTGFSLPRGKERKALVRRYARAMAALSSDEMRSVRAPAVD